MPIISASLSGKLRNVKENYPFALAFDKEQLIATGDWSAEELSFIELFAEFNYAFISGLHKAYKTLKKAGFSSQDLINGLFAKANKHNLIVQGKIHQGYEKSEQTAFDFERIRFMEIEDYDGNPQNAVKSVEFLGEIIGFILAYQEQYNFLSVEQEDDPAAKKDDLDIIVQYLIINFNIIYNLRIAYHLIVYKKVEVTWKKENEIKLGPDSLGLDIIATINEIRQSNQFNEAFFPAFHAMKKLKKRGKIIDKVTVIDGELNIALVEGVVDFANLGKVIAVSAVFYDYLSAFTFDALGNVDITTLLNLLEKLSDLTDSKYFDKTTVNTALNDIPYKITLSNLELYLSESAGVDLAVAKKFIGLMFHSQGEEVDFFRYPLYRFNGYVYLLHSTLAAPLSTIFVERWLKACGLERQEQSELFGKYVEKDLTAVSKKLPKGIHWEVIDTPEGFPKNVVTLQTLDHLIFITCQCLAFTGDSREEMLILEVYREHFEGFLNAIGDFAKKSEPSARKILPVCITSNIHYSGFRINGVPVLDLILFKNYFMVGRYAKVKLLNDRIAPAIKDLFEHEYYANQAEFELNLVSFLLKPYPLHVLLAKLVYKESPLLPPDSESSISYHIADMISIEEENRLDIEDLEYKLNTQFFINDNDINADKAINGLLTKIFNRIGDKMIKDQDIVPKLIDAITRSKRITSIHLVVYIRSVVQRLKYTPNSSEPKFQYATYEEEIVDIMARCMDQMHQKHLRLSEFKWDFKLSDNERKKLLSFILDTQATLAHKRYYAEEEKEIMVQIIIFRAHVREDNEIAMLFIMIGNFVESLNFNQRYQTARELSQEAWLLSINLDYRIYGLNILFKCYLKQKNFLHAGIYGGILVSIVDSLLKIDNSLFIDILYNLLRYFREFGYHEFAKSIWKFAVKLKLGVYDEQKFTISYFNVRLSKGLGNDPSLISAVNKYLEKNIEKIIEFGDHGISPWLALCMNVQKHIELGNIQGNEKLKTYRKRFEDAITEKAILENMQFQVKGITESPKDELIESLSKVYSAQYFEEFKYDVLNLRPLADNMFMKGLKNMDVDLLLLTSLIYNDQRLKFNDVDSDGELKEFGKHTSRLDPCVLSSYSFFIVDKLNLTKGQVLLWLVELNGKVYFLRINADQTIFFTFLPDWDVHKMSDWIRKSLPKFYFNSQKSSYYDLAEQEAATEKLLASLGSFDLKMGDDFEELLILKSVDMAGYPDNLIVNQGSFVSEKTPICNILNLEHFIANHKNKFIGLKINAWLPKEGKDGTISFGHDELLPLLAEKNAQIFDTTLLIEMPRGDVNIFMAHGNVGTDGFKSFQSDHKKIQFNSSAFGTGSVAILFICNSGNLKDDFQSQDIRSLAQDLIAQGYSAVVAPFWKYDVTMAHIWLKEFFKVFADGYSLNQAVHLSNRKVAQYDETTSRMFSDPGGWAAMHLYGNPNIFLGIEKTVKGNPYQTNCKAIGG